jgi:ArsR family transcriptional regulator
MVRQRAKKRLERLVRCGLCKGESASQYAAELERLAENIADIESATRQSKFFKALADQTRLRILKLLQVREMCVCELMTALDLTQPTTSHHLHVLEDAGFVKNRKEGKWVFYSLKNVDLIKQVEKLRHF